MDMATVSSRLYGLCEALGLWVGQYSLLGLSMALEAIGGLSGLLSSWCYQKSMSFKEKRVGKGEGPSDDIPIRPDSRIPEGSSSSEVADADEGAVPEGSGERSEVSEEEPISDSKSEEGPKTSSV